MLDRILQKPTTGSTDDKDCLSCRLIGGGGMACLGSYVLYKTYTGRHSMTKWSLIGSSCLATVILSIASLRLLNVRLNRFEDNHRNNHSN